MNPQPLDDSQDNSPSEPGDGIGRRLRAARIDRGLDLEQVAAQLHLPASLVGALEAGRYEALPSPVFVAGYIRNYAREVGLDPEPLVTAYLSAHKQGAPARLWTRPLATGGDRGGSGFLIRLVTVVLVAGVAYLFVQWWQNRAPMLPEPGGEPAAVAVQDGAQPAPDQARPGEPEAAEPRVPSPSLANGTAAGGGSTVALVAGPATPAVPSEPELAMPAGDLVPPPEGPRETSVPTADESEADSASRPAAPDNQEPASPDTGDVVLEFRGPCWVDVRDSAKSFSLTGEMSKGDRRVLGGTPPYSLILGNASAVTVTVKGSPFDLNRVAKGNVARFKLDPAALP
jgi:cytoskeleton protein RodZ